MKNKIMKNLGLKILSLVVAVLFWLVVINLIDPVTSRTFYNIPVKILNENTITSANQVYEVVSGDHIQVTVKGKRSFVEMLTSSDFEASADLSELSKVNAVNIDVKLTRNTSTPVELDWDSTVLKVSLEKRVSQKFRVEVTYQGELSEDYELGDIVAKPNIVEVSCGQSKFRQIDHVGVTVNLNGESDDFEKIYTPILYDSEGGMLDSTNVSFSNDSIVVSIEVLPVREIPVEVVTTGTPAAGYQLVRTDFRPETIRVTGSDDALKGDLSLKIPVDIDGKKEDVEREIVIADYLPEELTVMGDVTTVSVYCDIEKNGRRTFILTASDIAVRNLPQNCTMEFYNDKARYYVVVTGDEEDLKDLTMNDLGVYVDLEGLGAGQHNLVLQYQLPSGVKVDKDITVLVVLRSQNGETPVPTEPGVSTPSPTTTSTPSVEAEE